MSRAILDQRMDRHFERRLWEEAAIDPAIACTLHVASGGLVDASGVLHAPGQPAPPPRDSASLRGLAGV